MKNQFFTLAKNYKSNYLVSLTNFDNEFLSHDENIALPLVVDTEFVTAKLTLESLQNLDGSSYVTTQVKHTHHNDAQIFAHASFAYDEFGELKDGIRHPVTNSPFVVGDYLESNGFDNRIFREDEMPEDKLSLFVVVLYGHFLIADVTKLFNEVEFLQDLNNLIATKRIEMKRRLSNGMACYTKTNWFIEIGGKTRQIALKFVDTVAIHGVASYKDFCTNSGIVLDSKDNMAAYIEQMDVAYFEHSKDFDDYSLGDLHIYDALNGYANLMRHVWRDLNIDEYYQNPSLSIGSSVAKLFESKVFKLFDLPPEITSRKEKSAFLEKLTQHANTNYFLVLVTNYSFLLSKCDGGRCRSNNPILTSQKGYLADIDIAGAYTTAMSICSYPFGSPVVLAAKYKTDYSNGVPLRDVLRALKDELLPRLWYARIQTTNLKFEQDLIPSWCDFGIDRKTKIDKSVVGNVKLETGFSKIFSTEIHAGALTSEILDVILQCWTPRQRDDFLDNTKILAIAFYPKSLEQSVNDFTSEIEPMAFGCKSKIMNQFEPATHHNHRWCHVPLGEFFTDVLKSKRAMYAKDNPLNTLYKLLGNTSYGDAVSKYFETSNMIVGNNITGCVRSFMWLSEKALNLYGSITDGQVFDLNNVLHRKGKYLKTEALARLYSIDKREFYNHNAGHLKPLTNRTDLTKTELDAIALEHVKTVWNKSTLLNDVFKVLKPIDGNPNYENEIGCFRFETKDFHNLVVLHGSSNYSFNPLDAKSTKMRSYESKRKHLTISLNDIGELIELDTYDQLSPAQILMREIQNNPHAVKRLPPFVKFSILKPSEYANNYTNKWSKTGLSVGDNVLKCGKPLYCTLSPYLFKTLKQYQTWSKTHESLKRKYGESFEIFFTNEDDTIDYQRMIIEIDRAIRNDVINPMTYFERHRHTNRLICNTTATFHGTQLKLQEMVKTCAILPDYEDMEIINDKEIYQ